MRRAAIRERLAPLGIIVGVQLSTPLKPPEHCTQGLNARAVNYSERRKADEENGLCTEKNSATETTRLSEVSLEILINRHISTRAYFDERANPFGKIHPC